jgi:hypothetical protein
VRSITICFLLILLFATFTGCASPQHTPDAQCIVDSKQQYDDLRQQLIDLKDRDQEIRAAVVAAMQTAERGEGGSIRFDEEGTKAMQAMSAIDAESSAFLEEMIAEYGWPTIDMVGKDGAYAAWLLAQHADAKPELQQRALDLMEPLVEQGQAEGRLFAMLTDRVLSGRGEPQVYGTQFTNDDEGILRPSPTIDWEHIDERRARVGLEPIAEYAKRLGESYNEPVSTEPMPIE